MADAVRESAAAPATGAQAVQSTSALKNLSEAETVQSGFEGVRIVEDRTYFFRDGFWTDSDFDGDETIDILIYGNAYFDLIDAVPWIGPHLAIGERIIVRVGDAFVRIGDEGASELTDEVLDALIP